MDVLEQLIIEHRVVTALLTRLDAAELSSRDRALTELVDALSTHMEIEERTVHPIIEACLGRPAATGADEEHDNVRHALSKLFELFDDHDRFAGTLADLRDDFFEHVAGEEQDLFPALRSRAPSEIAELGNAHQVEERVKSELAVEGLGGSY